MSFTISLSNCCLLTVKSGPLVPGYAHGVSHRLKADTLCTRHGDVFAVTVEDDVLGLTVSQTSRLYVICRRFTVSVRTWHVNHLHAVITLSSVMPAWSVQLHTNYTRVNIGHVLRLKISRTYSHINLSMQ